MKNISNYIDYQKKRDEYKIGKDVINVVNIAAIIRHRVLDASAYIMPILEVEIQST